VAAVSSVTVVSESDVEPVSLPGGSWSRILISSASVDETAVTLGRSVFKAGTVTDSMRHESDEIALVVSGRGFLVLEDSRVELAQGEACHIPAGVWHAVGADSEDMAMVFGFSHPSYPPTEFRELR